MKIGDILNIESNNDGCIHIIRDRLFWVVYELSAYYFVTLLRPYTVHCKYVKSVSRDVVWLGFPDCALSKILDEAMHNGYRVQNISSGHIQVQGVRLLTGFDIWKNRIIRPGQIIENVVRRDTHNWEYSLFKHLYDFSLYVLKLVPKFDRSYRFSLGQQLADITLGLGEHSFIGVNCVGPMNVASIFVSLMKARLYFRLANDLHQVSQKQWLAVNNMIEEMLRLLPQESVGLRTDRDVGEESSRRLTSVYSGSLHRKGDSGMSPPSF